MSQAVPRRWVTFAMVALVLAAFCEFMVRGPLYSTGHADFAAPYVAGLRFIRGEDPYSRTDFLSDWHNSGAGPDQTVDDSGTRPIYPPSTLSMMSVFVPLRWNSAVTCYLVLCSASYFGLIGLLAREIGGGWNSPARLGFGAFALALAPVHTGLHMANLSIAAFLLAGYSVWFASRNRDLAAGALLALSLCIKPTMAASLVVLYLVKRRWRLFFVSAGAGAAITAAALIRLHFTGGAWAQDYRANVAYLFSPSGAASYSTASFNRFDLLNLQLPFYELTHSLIAANLIPWTIAAALGAVWLRLLARRSSTWDWSLVGAGLLLGMLPIYQRNYNAGIVLFAVLWAMRSLPARLAKLTLLAAATFLLPVEAVLRHLVAARLSEATQAGVLWRAFLLPEACWTILALTVLLLLAAASATSGEGDPGPPAAARS